MEIEKLNSGNYRVRMHYNGKRHSLVLPYKPKRDEAYALIMDKIQHPNGRYDQLTLLEACDKYIDAKSNTLSPSTVRGYKCIMKNLPTKYMSMPLSAMDNITVQALINTYAKNRSAKTVRNANGFIIGVLKAFMPSVDIHTTLPQKVAKTSYMPTQTEVSELLSYAYESEFFVALSLACLSLRRSEICALTIDDLHDDNTLTINKALVPDENNEYVVKSCAKTYASNRTIVVPSDLAERIRSQGYIYKYTPNAIDKYLRTTLPKLGIPVFSIHRLRHFFASYFHGKYTDKQIMAMGGWSTPNIMRTTYTHVINEKEAIENMSNEMGDIFMGRAWGERGAK